MVRLITRKCFATPILKGVALTSRSPRNASMATTRHQRTTTNTTYRTCNIKIVNYVLGKAKGVRLLDSNLSRQVAKATPSRLAHLHPQTLSHLSCAEIIKREAANTAISAGTSIRTKMVNVLRRQRRLQPGTGLGRPESEPTGLRSVWLPDPNSDIRQALI